MAEAVVSPAVVVEFSKEKFMDKVRMFPVLYDKFNAEFKDKTKKQNAWVTIGALFNMTAKEAEEKYKSIRTSYGRYLKTKKNVPSGSGRNAVPPQYMCLE